MIIFFFRAPLLQASERGPSAADLRALPNPVYCNHRPGLTPSERRAAATQQSQRGRGHFGSRTFFFFLAPFSAACLRGGAGREGPHRRGGTRLAGGGRSQRPSARTSCRFVQLRHGIIAVALARKGSSSKEDANARWAATARSAAHRATQAA